MGPLCEASRPRISRYAFLTSSHKHATTIGILKTRGGSDWRYEYGPDYNDGDDRRQRKDTYADDEDYYPEEDYAEYYDDTSPTKRRSSRSNSPLSNMPDIIRNGDRRIGIMLLGSGAAVTMLGMSLFFNKALMRLGNLLFIAGVPMTIGPSRTIGYFVQREKMRATACLAAGIFLVLVGWPILGMILEAFGLLNLFGNMFPLVAAVARTMPGIGPLLNGMGGGPTRRREERQRYEDDYYTTGAGDGAGEYYEDDVRSDDSYYGARDTRYY